MVWSPDTQMLQPMHSRMSSLSPWSIFLGRKGSAIEGRAAPMKSSTPRLHLRHHRVGGGEPADAHHRLAGHRLHEAHEVLLIAFGREARGLRIVRPVAHVDVPQVRQLREHGEDLAALARGARCRRSPSSSSTAKRTATAQCVAHRLLGVLDQLPQQAATRLTRLPPYSSLRWLWRRCRKCIGSDRPWRGIDVDRCRNRRGARAAPPAGASAAKSRDVGLGHGRAPGPGRSWRGSTDGSGPGSISREYRLAAFMPPCASSIAASAPCSWIARVSAPAPECRESSHRRPSMIRREIARVGWISTSSVLTTAQPPSAFTARMAAWLRGLRIAHAVAMRNLKEAVSSRSPDRSSPVRTECRGEDCGARCAHGSARLRRCERAEDPSAQLQPLAVAGELQVAAAHRPTGAVGPHRALPVNRAGGDARVVLLIVEQRPQIDLDRADAYAPCSPDSRCRCAASASGARARSAPRRDRETCTRPAGSRSVPPAQRVAPVAAAHAKRHQRGAVVEVDADPIPADRLAHRDTRSTIRDRARPRRSPAFRARCAPTVPATARCGRL